MLDRNHDWIINSEITNIAKPQALRTENTPKAFQEHQADGSIKDAWIETMFAIMTKQVKSIEN